MIKKRLTRGRVPVYVWTDEIETAAVGVDIGCGMCAGRISLRVDR